MVSIRRKTEKERRHEEEREIMHNIIRKYNKEATFPKDEKKDRSKVISREYKIFKQEEAESKEKRSFFEYACAFSEKTANVGMGEKSKQKYQAAIDFSGLNVTPKGVASFAVLTALVLFLAAIFIVLAFPSLSLLVMLIVLLAPFAFAFMAYNYPMNYANVVRIKTGGELVMGILYIIVYMRTTPNIEGAIRYAAENVTGKLSGDFKKVLWSVEVGQYTSVDDALTAYIMQWRAYNKEFIEAIQLVRESMMEMVPERRELLLDKAIDIVLQGTDEKMKKYSRDLETPVMIIHGFGIMLPVLGMIVFPLISIFLSDNITGLSYYLFFGYNIVLPLLVFYFMKQIMDKRPATSTTIDISNHPDFAPENNIVLKLKDKRYFLPVWPFAFAVSLLGFLLALGLYGAFMGVDTTQANIFVKLLSSPMFHSIIAILSIAVGIAVYFRGASFQKTSIRSEIVSVESEFEDALFALGNRIHGGTPMELALSQAYEDTKQLTISGLFKISLKNINMLSMTFKQSLFDERYGALRYYPSKLIRTIMKSIAESVDKGTKAASLTMLTISRYLRDLHTTQEKIEDVLSSITSSMKFQAYVLVPTISGVVVAVSKLILQMLQSLGESFEKLESASAGGEFGSMDLGGMMGFGNAVPPEVLQFIVGLYVIEILVLLAIFVNRISVGMDPVSESDSIWKMVLTGTFVYVLVIVIVSLLFMPLINVATNIV
ncbi:MAG: hypothetical protein KAT91_00700 [Candidatus Aenigmarchaeota archaeon]|nr:hypothetical protein [Candidatus Aenigmarchaeota archaeon]